MLNTNIKIKIINLNENNTLEELSNIIAYKLASKEIEKIQYNT